MVVAGSLVVVGSIVDVGIVGAPGCPSGVALVSMALWTVELLFGSGMRSYSLSFSLKKDFVILYPHYLLRRSYLMTLLETLISYDLDYFSFPFWQDRACLHSQLKTSCRNR